MCGIAVAYQVDEASSRAALMLELLRHRGDHDDPVLSLHQRTALGIRRLRILDWEKGVQPTWSADGRYVVVLNGEIYNFRELRRELSSAGVRFHTDCDTEVLANALASWGPNAIRRLRGMFAFVGIDCLTDSLVAARDRFGIKPLYICRQANGLLLASEVKPLLSCSSDGPVEELPPGTVLSGGRVSNYGVDLTDDQAVRSSSISENAKRLYGYLHSAVKARLPDDLPSAVLFGGGVDSTLILHIARRFNRQTKAYLISNNEGRDRPYAMEYAELMDVELATERFTEKEALGLLSRVVATTETFEPNVVRNGVFSYLLSRRLHVDGIRVALCGEGADELFCGYPELSQDSADVLERRDAFLTDLHRTQLQRVDRCSMAHSLETRVPFLDQEVAAFAGSVPLHQLVAAGAGKVVNKAVLRQIYDEDPSLRALSIGRRDKVVFADGAGMGDNSDAGPFFEHAQEAITDAEFKRVRDCLPHLDLRTKEEVLYYQYLRQAMDVERVPFLQMRPRVNSTTIRRRVA